MNRISAFLIRLVKDAMYDVHARRAFANNAFDGALTFLGILLGNIVLNNFQPVTVIYIGLSTCLAIGMSGAFGRFLSERAERPFRGTGMAVSGLALWLTPGLFSRAVQVAGWFYGTGPRGAAEPCCRGRLEYSSGRARLQAEPGPSRLGTGVQRATGNALLGPPGAPR